ncbi:hypothetical protein F8568_016750 [Actinomadura sp. LD22]|uniref:Uncharacterized protein n=1 Tax=Actinomadura physcomitrii TaxID=2650748 RepID=A0A6I4MDU1_9ACTN|nr:hypothetical protein [Actinomadura physcomitrii]MWA01991.1 hypothetical protein [Actinomadura physcomitrii]
MRLRTAVTGAAVAMAIGGLGVPAQAATTAKASPQYTWTYIGNYGSKKACVDMGQQYEREGWNAYKCTLDGTSFPYVLWVR